MQCTRDVQKVLQPHLFLRNLVFTIHKFKAKKKVHSMSISELLRNKIFCFPHYLFPPFNKGTCLIIVKFYGLHLYPVSDRFSFFLSMVDLLDPPCQCAVVYLIANIDLLWPSACVKNCFSSNSRNLITTLCYCQYFFGSIIPILLYNKEDTVGCLKFER